MSERDSWGNRPDAFRPFFCDGRADGTHYTMTMLDAMIHACRFVLDFDRAGQDEPWQTLYDWAAHWLPRLQAAKDAPLCAEKLLPEVPWITATKEERLGLLSVVDDLVEYETQQSYTDTNDGGDEIEVFADAETASIVLLLRGAEIALDPDQFERKLVGSKNP